MSSPRYPLAGLALLLSCLAALCAPSLAFKPLSDSGHSGLVQQALTGLTTMDSAGRSYKFSRLQILRVQAGVVYADTSSHFFDPEWHCDSEQLANCSNRILNEQTRLKTALATAAAASVTDLVPLSCYAVQNEFGQLLHTLQDFYAHSNWVDIQHNSTPNPTIGTGVVSAVDASRPCPDHPWVLDPTVADVTTGWYDAGLAADYALPSFLRLFAAPQCLVKIDAPDGKCNHGYDNTDIDNNCDGIAKDIADREPEHPYNLAFQAALTHTTSFVQRFIDGVRDPLQLQCLMTAGPQAAFNIDTTGSMADVIAAVLMSSVSIAAAEAASVSSSSAAPSFLLENFNDPYVGSPVLYNQLSAFTTAVNSLGASGGGDCPENSISGLISLAQLADKGATIYHFTDASAKDAALLQQAIALLIKKNLAFVPLLFGSCSPYDPVYFALAQLTQGHVFLLDRSVSTATLAGQMTSLITPNLQPNRTTLLITQTLLTGTAAWVTAVLLDSSAAFATFTVTADVKGSVAIVDGLGRSAASATSAMVVNSATAYQVTVPAVTPGYYTISVTGSGSAALSVTASSVLQLVDAFVAVVGGRHMDYIEGQSQPVALSSTTIKVQMSTPASGLGANGTSSLQVLITAVSSQVLLALQASLYEDDPVSAMSYWLVTFPCPSTPFRVQVIGVLAATMQPFQRTWPQTFVPQAVTLSLPTFSIFMGSLLVGATTWVPFNASNSGPSASFQLSVVTDPIALPVSVSIVQPTSSGGGTQWVSLLPVASLDNFYSRSSFVATASTPATLPLTSAVVLQLAGSSVTQLAVQILVPAALQASVGKAISVSLLMSPVGSSTVVASTAFDATLVACGFNGSAVTNRSACTNVLCDMAVQSPTVSILGQPWPLPAAPTSTAVNVSALSISGRLQQFQCGCATDWAGPTCSALACPNNCSSHGQCTTILPAVCVCSSPWGGADCSTYLGPLSLRAEIQGNTVTDPLGGLTPAAAITHPFTLWLSGVPGQLSASIVTCTVSVVDANTSAVFATYSNSAANAWTVPTSALGHAVRFRAFCPALSDTHSVQIPLPLTVLSNVLALNATGAVVAPPTSPPLSVTFVQLPSLADLAPCSSYLDYSARYFSNNLTTATAVVSWQQDRILACSIRLYLNRTAADTGAALDATLLSTLTVGVQYLGLVQVTLPVLPTYVLSANSVYRLTLVSGCDGSSSAVSDPLVAATYTNTSVAAALGSTSPVPTSAASPYSVEVTGPTLATSWSSASPVPAVSWRLLGYSSEYISLNKNALYSCPGLIVATTTTPSTDRVLVELLSSGGRPLLNLSSTLTLSTYCVGVYCTFTPAASLNLSGAGITSGTYIVRVRSLVAGWTASSAGFSIVSNAGMLTATTLQFTPPFSGVSAGYYPYSTLQPTLLDARLNQTGAQVVVANSSVALGWSWTGNILAVSLALLKLNVAVAVSGGSFSISSPLVLNASTIAALTLSSSPIALNVLNSGSYTWTLPSSLDPAFLYVVNLTAAAPVVASTVSAPFVVSGVPLSAALPAISSSSSSSSSSTAAPSTGSTASLLPSSSTGASGSVVGDPKFVGLLGQSFQVHGIDGAVYSLISHRDLQINALFRFLDSGRCPVLAGQPQPNCWSHSGSYLGELSIQQRVEGRLHRLRLTAGGHEQGFAAVLFDGQRLGVGQTAGSASGGMSVRFVSSHAVHVRLPFFTLELSNSDLFLNQALTATVPLSQLQAEGVHGLLGQTHSSRTYPTAIRYVEGEVDDYAMADGELFGHSDAFNKFEPAAVAHYH